MCIGSIVNINIGIIGYSRRYTEAIAIAIAIAIANFYLSGPARQPFHIMCILYS
ncbi:hypothetical protein NW754_014038 [Fusarium falciforme]|uniref:Uncharacterized protein n=1 Tax=Fusarium falciforme TaxID=195108 RepID=A0A9W8RCA1_9HYPO|nr:hypothetical protein NW754_014038 [Fusarium falciforme]KAJ4192155.1 hypothetical protein NW755_004285 [Fusarium falciforme]KAJ4254648.1 hypothetical protein NW757_004980 [Fusarium falciforme]